MVRFLRTRWFPNRDLVRMTDFLRTSGSSLPRNKTRRIAAERRRLTLGVMDRPVDPTPARMPADNSGLISFLKNTQVTDIVRNAKRKLSFSSMTHESGQDSFDEKPTTSNDQARTREDINRLGIGVVCKKRNETRVTESGFFQCGLRIRRIFAHRCIRWTWS